MVQITGRQTGTPQDEIFTGDLAFIVEESTTQAAILNATINGLGGLDLIEGTSVLEARAPGIEIETNGIAQSTISGDLGNDVVFATGSSRPSGTDTDFTATGRGLFRSSVIGGNGQEDFVFTGEAIGGVSSTGIGVENSSADGGSGADDIKIEGFVRGFTDSEQTSLTAIGARNGVITGGGQDDDITIEAEIENSLISESENRGVAVVKAAEASFISGDGGNDEIDISAFGVTALNSDVAAVSNSEIRGGASDDLLSISSFTINDSEGDVFADTITTSAVEKGSLISGDSGNDSFSIFGRDSTVAFSTVYGVNDSEIKGGNGTDSMSIRARADQSNGEAFGTFNANIDGENDDDRIRISAELRDSNTSGAAANLSVISGGSGNDDIIIGVKAESSEASRDITGLLNSEVYGNSGNDRILVSTEGPIDYNIIDSQLFGGAGDDRFNVGIGNGKLVGGAGNDTAVLDYLSDRTTTITAINNGIRITGTQTNTGQEGAWTQDILSTENYLVDGTTYTNDTLLQTFG